MSDQSRGSCRRVSPLVLGAKRTITRTKRPDHGVGACAASGDAPPGATRSMVHLASEPERSPAISHVVFVFRLRHEAAADHIGLANWSGGSPSLHRMNRNLLDGIVAVTEPIPFGAIRLSASGEIGRARADGDGRGSRDVRGRFPPLPAVTAAVADESSLLPGSTVHADLDTGDRCRA